MSGYRSYVPWPKSSSSSSSYSSKKDVPTTSKYEPSYTSRSRSESKKVDDKSSSSLGSKYSAYGAGYQRDSNTSTSALPTRTDLGRYKADKKDTLHPPISYRPITRTSTSRSRDPSPAERSKTESSSSSSGYNLNRLYPSSYSTRSVSRERTEPSSTTTIPKYTGRSSINKDDCKYSIGRTSRDVSREDLSSIASSSRYKTASSGVGSASSREDLTKPSQKYITSRFLPKNSVEKSYTAYTRTATGRASEASRKNRELLNVLSAQADDKSSPSSRSSSTHEIIRDKPKELPKIDVVSYEDLETVSVVTRSTSPNPPSQTSVLRTRRLDNARLIEKQITRPKKRPEMVDKELQSDRLDDSTKTSRFAGASRIAAPWSSYLDLKYSSPNEEKQSKSNNSSQSDLKEDAPQRKGTDSPKPLSRNNSAKSISHSSSKSDIPTKDIKPKSTSSSSCDKPKSKLTPPRSLQNDAKKQLPPQIPKPETTTKSSSNSTPNKDFRKSILNMSNDAKAKKKSSKRSNSVSSADSDGANSEATEASENLSSCVVTFQRSSSISKLPQKSAHLDESRSCRSCTRSPSIPSDTSATTSGSEDDGKSRVVSKLKKFGSSSKTSSQVSAVEDLSDKSPKPPLSPRVKPDSPRTEAEAKSFLMRALAPVTNFFKHKNDSSDKLNILDSTCDNITEIKSDSSTSNLKSLSEQSQDTNMIPTKIEICRVQPNEDVFNFERECRDSKSNEIESSKSDQLLVPKILFRIESGERAWWLQDVSDENKEISPGRHSRESTPSDSKRHNSSKLQIRSMKHAESGDIPWWLQENPSEIPEGVKVWPAASSTQDGVTEDGRSIYKVRNDGEKVFWFEETEESASSSKSGKLKIKVLRHVDSDEKPWWLDENADAPDGVQTYPNYKAPSCENLEEPEEKHKWLVGSNEDSADEGKLDEQSEPDFLRKYKIRHIDSGERAWWLNSVENIADNTNEPPPKEKPFKIAHQDSAEKPWWLESDIPKKEDEDSDNESNCDIPLGDRASPEGLETPREETTEGRLSPYDNVPSTFSQKKSTDVKLFICKHTNIDDILGGSGQLLSPLMNRIFSYQEGCDYDDEKCEEIDPDQVIIHEGTAQRGVIRPTRLDVIGGNPPPTPYTKVSRSFKYVYNLHHTPQQNINKHPENDLLSRDVVIVRAVTSKSACIKDLLYVVLHYLPIFKTLII